MQVLQGVPLEAMGQFVGDDHGELGLVLQPGQEPCRDVDPSVRQGKGVQTGIFQDKDGEGDSPVRRRAFRQEIAHHLMEICMKAGIPVKSATLLDGPPLRSRPVVELLLQGGLKGTRVPVPERQARGTGAQPEATGQEETMKQ